MRIDVTIRINGRTYTFYMTNHMQHDGSLTGYDTSLQTIAQWILASANDIWMNLPVWYLSGGFRICPIFPTNPLWQLLDSNSKKQQVNWLIFQNHPLHNHIIRITHFGPFGTLKNSVNEANWNSSILRFSRDIRVVQFKAAMEDGKLSAAEKEKAKKEFKKHLNSTYVRAKAKLTAEVEKAQSVIQNIIKVVFGVTEAAAVLSLKVSTALAPSVVKIGCKLMFKEIIAIISKELAKEIAVLSAKIAGKESGKAFGKKIPGVGLFIGAGMGIYRAYKRDFSGALLEVISGSVSTVPGIGTIGSLAVDAILAGKDVYEAISNLRYYEFQLLKLGKEIEDLLEKIKELDDKNDLIQLVFSDSFSSNPVETYGDRFAEAFSTLKDVIIYGY